MEGSLVERKKLLSYPFESNRYTMVATTIVDFRQCCTRHLSDNSVGLHGLAVERFMVNVVKLLRVYGG